MSSIVKMDDVEMPAARLPNRVVRELMQTDHDGVFERIELLEGVLVDMPPTRRRHTTAHTRLLVWFGQKLSDELELLIDPAIYLGEYSMLGPDIVILPRETTSADPDPLRLKLAVEISDTTLAKDLKRKARIYGEYGVVEYWVVDVVNRATHVHRDPSAAGYRSVDVVPWVNPQSPLFTPDLAVTLSAIIPEDAP